ncbi:MAG: 2,3-bisphosphoglycerate-independent phosphoglycerate mutase [Candidatus Bilamarchaeaceae archaeon]
MKLESVILLIIDGLGDLPTPKTPLQVAKKPNMDRLAKDGITGMFAPLGRWVVPGSDTSHLQIFGYDPEIFYHGRGPLEALGIGMELKSGDIAFRANLATVDGERVVDRRAGRISTDEGKHLEKYLCTKIEDVEAIFAHSVEHRGALVLRGPGLSPAVSDTDPHTAGEEIRRCVPLDSTPEAEKTARIVNAYTRFALRALSSAVENKVRQDRGQPPANALLLRGCGRYEKVPSFFERFGLKGVCIAGGALYRGVARYIGMDIISVPSSEDERSLSERAMAAAKATANYDLVFLHIKGCDNAGHDGNFDGKRKMIERIDKKVLPPLMKSGADIIITGDHSTPVARREHSGHEIPILIWSKEERRDSVKRFDELNCMYGGLGHVSGEELIRAILNLLKKAEKRGS